MPWHNDNYIHLYKGDVHCYYIAWTVPYIFNFKHHIHKEILDFGPCVRTIPLSGPWGGPTTKFDHRTPDKIQPKTQIKNQLLTTMTNAVDFIHQHNGDGMHLVPIDHHHITPNGLYKGHCAFHSNWSTITLDFQRNAVMVPAQGPSLHNTPFNRSIEDLRHPDPCNIFM